VLGDIVETFRRDTGIAVRFVTEAKSLDLSPRIGLELVRIVREALVNVRRHSHARHALVSLRPQGAGSAAARPGSGPVSINDSWVLAIEDDGCGFAFEGRLSAAQLEAQGLGPAIIRERVRTIAADLAVESRPGKGSRLEIRFAESAHA